MMLRVSFILQMTLLIFLTYFGPSLAHRVKRVPMEISATKCEGDTVYLICPNEGIIEITSVMYGRKGDVTCPNGPIPDTNCEAEGALDIVAQSCNGLPECQVDASNEVFGDPCVGTFKYLYVQYICHDDDSEFTVTERAVSIAPGGEIPYLCSNISTAYYYDEEGDPIPENCLTYYELTLLSTYHQAYVLLFTSLCPDIDVSYDLNIEGQLDNNLIYAKEYEEEPSNATFSATIIEQVRVTDDSTRGDLAACVSDLHAMLNEHYSALPVELDEIAAASSCPRLKITLPPLESWSGFCCPSGYYMESNMCYPSPTSSGATITQRLNNYCELTESRNITWLPTLAGHTDSQPCPEGATGTALWKCLEGGEWDPQGPNLANCTSIWVEELADKINSISNPEEAQELAEEVNKASEEGNILSGDIENLVEIVADLVVVLNLQLVQISDEEEKQVTAQSLVESNVGTCSNLLDLNRNQEAWDGLESSQKSKQASDLLDAVESSAFLLADNLLANSDPVTSQTDNILMQVSLHTNVQENVNYPKLGEDQKWDVSIEIPQESLAEKQTPDGVKLVFLTYDSVGDLLGVSNDVLGGPDNAANPVINSKVLSASINQMGASTPLTQPAKFVFQHQEVFNLSDAFCSYWNDTGSAGYWSGAGCIKVEEESTAKQTVCECDHLTNFAILMDVHGTAIPSAHEFALRLFTYIGFGISCFCLIFCIITFCVLRSLKSDRNTIHKNLCICLFIAEVIFMAGIEQTQSKVGCAVVAGLLQYFFLACFAWMALEGVQLYVMLVEVFQAEYSRRKYYYLVGYGVPAIIVGVSAGIRHDGYGTEDFCWLSTENGLIWSFVGPVLLVIVVNFGFLVMAMYIMCRHSTVTMKGKKINQKMADTESKWKSAATWIRGSVVLLCLLGITWGVGLFYINQNSLIMAYLFTIFNSLQGVAIFFFHCALNEKVRKEYKKCLYRSECMPECLRFRLGDSIYRDSLPPGSRSNNSTAKLQKVWYQNRSSSSTSSTYDKKYSTSTTSKNTVDTCVRDSVGKENGHIVPYSQMMELNTSSPCLPPNQGMGQRSPPRSISEPLQFEDGSHNTDQLSYNKHSKSMNDFKYMDQYEPEDDIRVSIRT